jgi:hydroxymethylbilane synthase
MSSILRIASRKSDLARLQSVHVAQLLMSHWPDLKIEFQFSESLGDKNLNDPLWKMPEKGVFTSDLSQGLLENRYDLVVHSWKDLPLEADSQVLGTPPREDPRDLILFRKEFIKETLPNSSLVVLSSSPRRAYNLEPFLKEYLPNGPKLIRFESVRGNIPTRLQKLIAPISGASSGAHALVVAKAAIDRLLDPPTPEFHPVRDQIRSILEKCEHMIVPLSLNPPAPAQGALALEVRKGDSLAERWIAPIVCAKSTQEVRLERRELARFGGGCHQKIGSSFHTLEHGIVHTLRGVSSQGELLQARELFSDGSAPLIQGEPKNYWSTKLCKITLFDREPISKNIQQVLDTRDGRFYVSHPDALPETLKPESFRHGPPALWCSGRMTWLELARRGFWVRGCDDGLGEQVPEGYTKLGHQDSPELGQGLATYRLIKRDESDLKKAWQLDQKTHFFWRSISQFERVSQSYPEILKAHHACGPGSTARWLKSRVKSLEVCLDETDWRRRHGIQ